MPDRPGNTEKNTQDSAPGSTSRLKGLRAIGFAFLYALIFALAQIIAGMMVLGYLTTGAIVRAEAAGTLDLTDNYALAEFVTTFVEAQFAPSLSWILLVACILSVLLSWLVVKVRRFNAKKFASLNSTTPLLLAASLLLGISISLTFNSVLSLPALEFFHDETTSAMQAMLFVSVLTAIVASTIVPTAEEIIFRGFMLNELRRGITLWPAIFLSSIIFGILHGTGQWAFIAVGIGLVLAWVALRTRSLYPAILAHVGINATSFAQVWLMSDTPSSFIVPTIAVGAIILIGTAVVISQETQPLSELEPAPEPTPKETPHED